MASITELADRVTLVLETVPNQLARETGCLQRHGKFDGATLVSTLVLGFWSRPEATLSQLRHMAAVCGVQVSSQGLDQRFTPQLAELLRQVLATAVAQTVTGHAVALPLLARFTGVYIQDCSTVSLPRELRTVWQGCGGKAGVGESAIKLGVQLDLLHGQLDGPHLASGRTHDRVVCAAMADLPPASLWMGDLGLVTLARLRTIAASGGYFLSRLKSQTKLATVDGQVWSQLEVLAARTETTIDLAVCIGSRVRLPVRLLAIRVPPEIAEERRERLRETAARKQQPLSVERLALAGWSIYVTNATREQLSLAEAAVLVRARWQIELLFKLWKQHARIDASRSRQPQRLLCELYAKLIGVVLQHWLVVEAAWHDAARSLVKLADIARAHVLSLGIGLSERAHLIHMLSTLHRCLQQGNRIDRRCTHPNTHQLLDNPALGGLA